MRINQGPDILRAAGELPPLDARPTYEFVANLYDQGGLATELDSYVGLSGLARPFGEQQYTVGQEFHRRRDPNAFQDPNAYMEFNRSVMNVWLYSLVRGEKSESELREAHQAFTGCQTEQTKLSFEDFVDLKQKCDETLTSPELEELFICSLVYADLGKSKRVLEYMEQRTGRPFADHDRLLDEVLEDPGATAACLPSLSRFHPELQRLVTDALTSTFHLPQFQQAENLPYHLRDFLQLSQQAQRFNMLNGLFDIGGAQGDRIQNGSATLTASTYGTFKKAWEAIHSRPDDPTASPEAVALHCYRRYLEQRAVEFGAGRYNPATAEGWALTRMAIMMRNLSPDDIHELPTIFDRNQSAAHRALITEALANTGFGEAGGAIWLQYHPSLYMQTLRTMRAEGVPRTDALVTIFSLLPRITTAARKAIDCTTQPVTTINVGEILKSTEQPGHWRRLLKEKIEVTPVQTKDGWEGRAQLVPVPGLEVGLGATAIPPATHEAIHLPGHMLFSAGGGGGSIWFARLAELTYAPRAITAVSVRGSAVSYENTQRLDEHVYLLNRGTQLGTRALEPLLTNNGYAVYLIDVSNGRQDYAQDYITVAEHAAQKHGRIGSVVVGNNGGNILHPPRHNPNRDHTSLFQIAQLETRLAMQARRARAPAFVARTAIFLPGVDAPAAMQARAKQAGARAFDLEPFASSIQAQLRIDNLPNTTPERFSGMVSVLSLVMSPEALADNLYGLQPLTVELGTVQRHRNPQAPFVSTTPSMRLMLDMPSDQLRKVLGLPAE